MNDTSPLVSRLVDGVHRAGATLIRLGPDALRLIDPAGAIAPDFKAELRAHRGELLAYLAPHPCVRCGRFAFPVSDVVCYWCRNGIGVRGRNPQEANR